MSPRASSSAPRSASSASAPYPRRAAGQPKSSRQQFSACGACRMRRSVPNASYPLPLILIFHRVRCDLKDLPVSQSSGGMQQPSCSNCKERGIKCVYVQPVSSEYSCASHHFPPAMSSQKSKPSSFYDAVGVYSKSSESQSSCATHVSHSIR